MTYVADHVQASKSGRAEHNAKRERLYYLMAAGKYLNHGGQYLQGGKLYAWKGTIDQARACRVRHGAAAGCRAVPVVAVSFTLQGSVEA